MRAIIKQVKENPPLWPIVVIIGGAATMAGAYCMRLLFHPHTVLDHTNNPYPWQQIKPDQNIRFAGKMPENPPTRKDPENM